VVRNRVVIATPLGPATGFTPRQFRKLTAVTRPIIADTCDKFSSSTSGLHNRQLLLTRRNSWSKALESF
jgi:hypothetical protein